MGMVKLMRVLSVVTPLVLAVLAAADIWVGAVFLLSLVSVPRGVWRLHVEH